MKLKALTVSLISLSLAACATQSMHTPQRSVDEQVYAGYEHLVSKKSYAFEGEVRVNMVPVATEVKKQNPILQTELNKLAAQRKLTATERQWLDEGIAAEQDEAGGNSKYAQIARLLDRVYIQYDGVVDIGHGQFSINPKIGYGTKNAQALVGFPLALDLRQSKFYADLSALSPALTNPQYDGRYMLFDYSNYAKLLKDRHLDVKPFIRLIREYILLNPALSTVQDYQTQALTDTDKQKGGVLRLSYKSNYLRLIQENLLFIYLNQPYIDQHLQPSLTEDNVNVLQSGLKSLTEASIGASSTSTKAAALQAKQRLRDAINAIQYPSNIEPEDDSSAPLASEDQSSTQKGEHQAVDIIDELILDGINEQIPKDQLVAALQAFDQYKTGELITAKQMKKIVAEQPEAYAQLGQSTYALFGDVFSIVGINSDINSDLVLDDKGRIIRADTSIKFSGLPEYGFGETTGTIKYNFYDYGRARVNAKALRQAVPYTQALNNNLPTKLNKLAKSERSTSSRNWSKEERYQQLARSLLAKNMTKFEVYHSVLWYASIVDSKGDLDPEQSKQLQQELLFDALQQANNEGWSLSSKQKQQLQDFEQHRPATQHLSQRTMLEVVAALKRVFIDTDIQQSQKNIAQQGKSTAEIFASMYEQLDRQAAYMSESDVYGESWQVLFKTLGEIAAQDIKTQKIDLNLLQNLDEQQLSDVDYDLYQQVYQLLLEHH